MRKKTSKASNRLYIKSNKEIAMHISSISIIVNLILSIFKLIAGITAKSGAMVSDAIHSASDVFSTVIVMIGVTIAGKTSDDEHPYGHERLECVASIILAVILGITGLGIGIKGVNKVIGEDFAALQIPGFIALVAAIVSIITKEWMYWYTRAAAKRINSGALMADAWHHRSDSLSSIGAFVGILGARMGLPVLDPIATIVICIFIEKAALEIFIDSINKMIDKSCSGEIVEEMKCEILKLEEIKGIDEIRTRLFGSRMYVDVEILVAGSKTLTMAHEKAEEVHFLIESKFPAVKHCMVHVNPYEENK